jgi:hypothetical protein
MGDEILYTHGYVHLDEDTLIAYFEYTPLGVLIVRNAAKRNSALDAERLRILIPRGASHGLG